MPEKMERTCGNSRTIKESLSALSFPWVMAF